MRIFDLLPKSWSGRVLALLTVVALVVLASHPELRLFVPLIEILGIDLFAVLVGAQIWSYVRPALFKLYRVLALPVAQSVYAATIWLLGIAGPYADETFRTRFPGCELRPNNSFKPNPLRGSA